MRSWPRFGVSCCGRGFTAASPPTVSVVTWTTFQRAEFYTSLRQSRARDLIHPEIYRENGKNIYIFIHIFIYLIIFNIKVETLTHFFHCSYTTEPFATVFTFFFLFSFLFTKVHAHQSKHI